MRRSGALYEEDCLHHERIELFGCSRGYAIVTHLSLADHVRDLYTRQDDARTPEILEPHHWFDDAFDGTVRYCHVAGMSPEMQRQLRV